MIRVEEGVGPKATVRRKEEFLYEKGQPKEIKPKAGYRGCYVLAHESAPGAKNPRDANVYNVILYVDAAAGAVTYAMTDDGDGLVVDVTAGCTPGELEGAVLAYLKSHTPPGGPESPPGTVNKNP